jgi:hypothetical protein
VLRRLFIVGLVSLCLAAPAQAGTVANFYYAWYGTPARDGVWQHWDQNGHRPPADVYSRYYPARGAYSSSDPALVNAQMAEIAAAGVDEVIVSWWGRTSTEDQRLPMVLAAARRHGLQPAIHLEPYAGRSTVTIAEDATYLASLGIRDVYVYQPRDIAASDWAALRPQLPPSLRLFAGTQLIGFAAAKFARLCAQARAMHILCAPSVGPGYDGLRAGEFSLSSSRNNGRTYDNLWKAAIAAHPDVITITSYNEWGEGTQIEPAQVKRGYDTYQGAWGLTGAAAPMAYLMRTTYWAGRFHASP